MRICPQCRERTPDRRCPEDGFSTVPADLYDDVDHRLVGTVFEGRYRLSGLIGKGGMGAVYQAEQLNVGDRLVAIKVLRRPRSGSLTEVARFQREVLAVSQMEHPNTIRVFDFGQTDGGDLYLVTELLQGRSLASELRQTGALAPARAARIGVQILKSLGEAHRASIVHRDIKPENIFLRDVYGERDFVKVLDFGLARLNEPGAETESDQLTKTGFVMGTPAYMSPEQARALPVDHRSDLYSVGVVMFQMLTGRRPFVAKTLLEQLNRHINDPVPGMSRWVVVDPELESLVRQCLSKKPDHRPRTARHLQASLERFLTGDPAALELTPVESALNSETIHSSEQPSPLEQTSPARPPLAATSPGRPRVPEPPVDSVLQDLEDSPSLAALLDESAPLGELATGETTSPMQLEQTAVAALDASGLSLDSGPVPSATELPVRGAGHAVWIGLLLLAAIALTVVGLLIASNREPIESTQVTATPVPSVAQAVPIWHDLRRHTDLGTSRIGRFAAELTPELSPPPDIDLAPERIDVRINAVPTDARLSIAGTDVGKAPGPVNVEMGRVVVVRVSRRGYVSSQVAVDGKTDVLSVRLRRRSAVRRTPEVPIESLPE